MCFHRWRPTHCKHESISSQTFFTGLAGSFSLEAVVKPRRASHDTQHDWLPQLLIYLRCFGSRYTWTGKSPSENSCYVDTEVYVDACTYIREHVDGSWQGRSCEDGAQYSAARDCSEVFSQRATSLLPWLCQALQLSWAPGQAGAACSSSALTCRHGLRAFPFS